MWDQGEEAAGVYVCEIQVVSCVGECYELITLQLQQLLGKNPHTPDVWDQMPQIHRNQQLSKTFVYQKPKTQITLNPQHAASIGVREAKQHRIDDSRTTCNLWSGGGRIHERAKGPQPWRRRSRRWGARTDVVDGDAAVGEAPRGAAGVEVAAVRLAVGAGERAEVVVGADVRRGVADHEERRDERRAARAPPPPQGKGRGRGRRGGGGRGAAARGSGEREEQGEGEEEEEGERHFRPASELGLARGWTTWARRGAGGAGIFHVWGDGLGAR